jgi:RNA polymerase sigma-70 factor (ECF subfamily)
MGTEAQRSNGTASASTDATRLLRAWREGDKSALERLTPIVYRDLRRLARRYLLAERSGHTLQPTALVNEAYMRLVDYRRMQWQDRAHFIAVSAQLMRRILVEHARRRNLKRGRDMRHVSLDQAPELGCTRANEVVALEEALDELARMDPRKARVVELRYFGGLSVEETAAVLSISAVTVRRDWISARAWLYRELSAQAIGADLGDS